MSDVKLLVHGYIRMEWPDETEIDLMRDDVASYCRINDYRLGSIFVDRGVPDSEFARTGFIDLLDRVRHTRAHAVVVPTVDHLSSQAFVLDALTRMVEQTEATVLVVYGVNGDNTADDHGQDLNPGPGVGS